MIKKCLIFLAVSLPIPLSASDQADVIYRGGAIVTIADVAVINTCTVTEQALNNFDPTFS